MSTSLIPVNSIIKLNEIESNESTKVMFVIAGLEGNVDAFNELAAYLSKHNVQVYGLQFTIKVPLETIKKMSIYYLNEILNQLNLDKKYEFYLAAYSFGGAIAIEMACILEHFVNYKYLNTNQSFNVNFGLIKLKKLFLFETSHVFFKVGAHLNFKIFQHDIVNDNILNHQHVYKAVLTIYTSGLYALNKKHKFQLYNYLMQNSIDDLDDTIEKTFDYLIQNEFFKTDDNDSSLVENKLFLKLLLLKSAAAYIYNYHETNNSNNETKNLTNTCQTHKLNTKIILFKAKLFLYSTKLDDNYFKMKNSIKFNRDNYNINEISHDRNFVVHEYANGNHWNFINENLDEISTVITNEMSEIKSKL